MEQDLDASDRFRWCFGFATDNVPVSIWNYSGYETAPTAWLELPLWNADLKSDDTEGATTSWVVCKKNDDSFYSRKWIMGFVPV